MHASTLLRTARSRAELTQSALARRAGTSQATLSSYEAGRKQPSAATLTRILAAAGWRLALEPAARPVIRRSGAELESSAATLSDVLALSEALPARHEASLRFPRLGPPS